MSLSKTIIKKFISNNKKLIISYLLVIIIAFPIEATAMSYIYGKLFKEFGSKGPNAIIIRNFFILAIIIWVVVGICRFIKNLLNREIIPRFYSFSRDYLFNLVLNKYKLNYSQPQLGDILTNFTEIPSTLFSLMYRMLNDHIPVFLSLCGIIGYTFYINYLFGIIMLIGLLCMIIISYYKSKECVDLNFQENTYFKQINENIQDRISNLFNIYTSGTEEYEKLLNYVREKEMEDKSKISMGCNGSMSLYVTFGSAILFAISLYIIYNLFKNKTVKIALLITATIMMTRYFSYYSSFFSGLGYTFHLIGTLRSADQFLGGEFIDNVKEFPDKIKIIRGSIVLQNITFKYPQSNKIILENASLKIQPNKITTIFGKSGSGKTTLIKLLMGFYKLDNGSIYIDGSSIENKNIEHLRSQIGFVNQNVDLFNMSVYENIKYGNNASNSRIYKYILEHKISSVFNNLTNGLNTKCGVNGSNLSRGQRQIVLLLRVLMKNTPILILDEPTSALDHNTKSIILKIIRKLCSKKTVIIITHDNDVLKYTDNKVRLINKKLIYF
jgi:ABC-type multidrug transport system fused ATPase/permease subunit